MLFTAGIVQAESFHYQISPEQISFAVHIPANSTYNVWHTTNPMKVVIDIAAKYPNLPARVKVDDVALKEIRFATGPNNGTRIVLDFDYLVSNLQTSVENEWLELKIDKVYVQNSLRRIEQGVRYGHERRGIVSGPLIVNYLEVDLMNPNVEIRSMIAQDQIYGKEYVSSMAARSQAIAAINGLYFANDGRPLGLLVIDQELVSEPYANRTAIGIGPGMAQIGPITMNGQVTSAGGKNYLISGLNRPRGADELVVYTPAYGVSSRTNIYGTDLIVENNTIVDIVSGDAKIPANGYVVSGHGLARDYVDQFIIGDSLVIDLGLTPDLISEGYQHIISGGPRLLAAGEIKITAEAEKFQADIASGRAPRTAIGITADQKLLLVTVNGRKSGISIGVTLNELAELMLELGAVDAMNLDGGGSTVMVIRDQVLNLPSDGVERPVSNAIVIITPESRY